MHVAPPSTTPRLPRTRVAGACLVAACGLGLWSVEAAAASKQPPPPCHANPHARANGETVEHRGDVRHLPNALRERLEALAQRPHSAAPTQAFAEADQPSQLFQFYLLDTKGFEPNPFTKLFQGVNDQAQLTATGFDCGLSTIGAVREVVEPKPDLPTDPNDVRAFIDIFTDISGLFVINNESGWYEGWMIHNLTVPDSAPTRPDGHARFGMLTAADKTVLAAMGGAPVAGSSRRHIVRVSCAACHGF